MVQEETVFKVDSSSIEIGHETFALYVISFHVKTIQGGIFNDLRIT